MNIAGAHIRSNHDAAGRGLAFDEFEGGGQGPFGKQALTVSKRNGEYFQPEFVHQIMFQKRLDEMATPMRLQVRTILLFELFYLICSVITVPRKSSKYGTVHPPCLNPPEGSSSAPPGAGMTPSRVTKDKTMSFRIFLPPSSKCCEIIAWRWRQLANVSV